MDKRDKKYFFNLGIWFCLGLVVEAIRSILSIPIEYYISAIVAFNLVLFVDIFCIRYPRKEEETNND